MKYNFAKAQAKRILRNTLIWLLLLALIVGALIFFFSPSLGNLYSKNASFSKVSELDALYDSKQNYVSIEDRELMHSGYVMTENGKEKLQYYFFFTEDGIVLCRSNMKTLTQNSYENFMVEGYLQTREADDNKLVNKLAPDLAKELGVSSSDIKEKFAPYVIDVSSIKLIPQALTGAGLILILLCLVQIIRAILGVVNYENGKWYRNLEKTTGLRPEEANALISQEHTDSLYIKRSDVKFTENWILLTFGMFYEAYPKSDLLWVYKTTTQHKTNGVPTGKSHALNLYFKSRKSVNLSSKNEFDADTTLSNIMSLCPDALYGYSDELFRLYNKNRAQMIEIAQQNAETRKAQAEQVKEQTEETLQPTDAAPETETASEPNISASESEETEQK